MPAKPKVFAAALWIIARHHLFHAWILLVEKSTGVWYDEDEQKINQRIRCMNAYFYTLGCKVNQYETQAMMRALREQGYETAVYHTGMPDVGEAVIVINSCTVTSESDRKLRQLLRRARRDNPRAVIVVGGCMPQAFPDVAAAFEEADIVLGNAARRTLAAHIERFCLTRERMVDIPAHDKTVEPMCIEDFEERTRAFVKIEDGCDRFCSYCIIPYARGRVRSRDPEDITAELQTLAANGYREVVLVGINLTSYGKDNGLSLADAVDAACAVEGIDRVRLGSLEPDHMTDALLARLAAQPKLCPQFHVALQSGCDATLKRMNRHYTTAEFAALCQQLRAAFPDCSLTTDIMVGFAGETDEDFEQSLAFATAMRFSKVHVFPYSRRDGTRAAKFEGQLGNAVKTERARRMTDACEAVRREILAQTVGTVQEVLCETRTENGAAVGYTKGYLPCRIGGDVTVGETVRVVVDNVENDTLYAHIL